VVRPPIARRDLSAGLRSLNEKEGNRDGQWKMDNREMTSAAKFLDESGKLTPSRLQPDQVLEALTGRKHEDPYPLSRCTTS
jgi:hypothetical protein